MIGLQNVNAARCEQYHREDFESTAVEVRPTWEGQLAPSLFLADAQGNYQHDFGDALRGHFKPGCQWARRPTEKRAALDVCVSAPKAVSVLALVLGDVRVIAVHRAAVSRVMQRVEQEARVRITQYKKTRAEPAVKLAWMHFLHTTSRMGDPNLHSHHTVLKAVLCTDGLLRALDNRLIFEAQHALDVIYKEELWAGIRGLGYQLEVTGAEPSITGVPVEWCRVFSSRSRQIEAALHQRGVTRKSASGRARQKVNFATRSAKQPMSETELRQRWQFQVAQCGHDARSLGQQLIGRTKLRLREITPSGQVDASVMLETEPLARQVGSDRACEVHEMSRSDKGCGDRGDVAGEGPGDARLRGTTEPRPTEVKVVGTPQRRMKKGSNPGWDWSSGF